MVLRKKKPNPALVTADVVAIAHFVVANIVLFIGEFTDLMDKLLRVEHPGIEFVVKYLDAPIYAVLQGKFDWLGEYHDPFFNILATNMVIVAGSIFYGFVVFAIVKVLSMIFGLEDNKPVDLEDKPRFSRR